MGAPLMEGCKECEGLKALLKEAAQYIPYGGVECHGDKCREPNCWSCHEPEYVREAIKENDEFRAKVNAALESK